MSRPLRPRCDRSLMQLGGLAGAWSLTTACLALALRFRLAVAQDAARDLVNPHDCRCWASQGQCESNKAWMLPNCAASCAWADACEEVPTLQARIQELETELARYKEMENGVKVAAYSEPSGACMQNASQPDPVERISRLESVHQDAANSEFDGAEKPSMLESSNEVAARSELDEMSTQNASQPVVLEQVFIRGELNASLAERIAKLEEMSSQQNAANDIAHIAMMERIDACTRNTSDKIRTLEDLVASMQLGRILHTDAQPDAHNDAQYGTQEESAGLFAWCRQLCGSVWPILQQSSAAFVVFLLHCRAHLGSLLDHARPMATHAWTALRSLFGHAGPMAAGAWTTLVSSAGHAGPMAADAWTTLESSFGQASPTVARAWAGLAALVTSISARIPFIMKLEDSEVTDSTAEAILSAQTKGSSAAASSAAAIGVIGLLVFCRHLRSLALWPFRFVVRCCRGLLCMAFWPVRAVCSCSRCSTRRNDDEETKLIRANMGVDNAMYYDAKQGKWRERGKEHLESEDVPLAPPPSMGSSAPRNVPRSELSALDSLMAPPNPYAQGFRAPPRHPPPPSHPPRSARSSFSSPAAALAATPAATPVATPAATPETFDIADDDELSRMF